MSRTVMAAVAACALSLPVVAGGPASSSASQVSTTPVTQAAAPVRQPGVHEAVTEPSARGAVDCRQVKCVALTYDDGPAPWTARLLDTLKRRHVKATFFMVGNRVSSYSSIVRRVRREGHVIGNHSWSHPDFRYISSRSIRRELARADRAIKAVTGRAPRLVRTPYGVHGPRIMRNLDGPMIRWSVNSKDYEYHAARPTIREVMAHVKPGTIILMHDLFSSTVDAAPRLIRRLRERGYHLVTVPQLFPYRLRTGHLYARLR